MTTLTRPKLSLAERLLVDRICDNHVDGISFNYTPGHKLYYTYYIYDEGMSGWIQSMYVPTYLDESEISEADIIAQALLEYVQENKLVTLFGAIFDMCFMGQHI